MRRLPRQSRRGWLFRILTDLEIRTPYLRNIAFVQCAKRVDADETFRSRIASLLKGEPSTLRVILDRLAASDGSRAVALAQIWKMVLRAELLTDLSVPLSMASEFSLAAPEVGHDHLRQPVGHGSYRSATRDVAPDPLASRSARIALRRTSPTSGGNGALRCSSLVPSTTAC